MHEINEKISEFEKTVMSILDNDQGFDPEDQQSLLHVLADTLEELTISAHAAISDHTDDYNAYMDHLERGGIYG